MFILSSICPFLSYRQVSLHKENSVLQTSKSEMEKLALEGLQQLRQLREAKARLEADLKDKVTEA